MESDFAYLRRRYGPRCANCGALLDFTRHVQVDSKHRSICDDCAAPAARERAVGDPEQPASERKS